MNIYADDIEITGAVGNLEWQNSIDELATTLTFTLAKTDAKYINIYTPKIGSHIKLWTGIYIFYGIIISADTGDKISNKYTAVDFGWYLNKSSNTYQFNEMTAYKAISKVCSDFNVDIDMMPTLDMKISKIYFDKTASDIIKDILSTCGGRYNIDMTPKGLRIYEIGTIRSDPIFKLSSNTKNLSSIKNHGNTSYIESIENMKNSIKVISETDGKYNELLTQKNDELISKYGLLQEVVSIDAESENANTTANAKLQELSKTEETFSFEIIESMDSYTRAGCIVRVFDVDYIVKSTSHSILSGVHYVKMDLNKFS